MSVFHPKPHRRGTNLVIPTDDVFREYAPIIATLRYLSAKLARDDLHLRHLAEYVVHQWIACAATRWYKETWSNGRVVPWTTYDEVMSQLYGDFLSVQGLMALPNEEARDIRTIVTRFASDFYQTLIPQIEQFNLSDYQIETMELIRWLGDSIVLDIRMS